MQIERNLHELKMMIVFAPNLLSYLNNFRKLLYFHLDIGLPHLVFTISAFHFDSSLVHSCFELYWVLQKAFRASQAIASDAAILGGFLVELKSFGQLRVISLLSSFSACIREVMPVCYFKGID